MRKSTRNQLTASTASSERSDLFNDSVRFNSGVNVILDRGDPIYGLISQDRTSLYTEHLLIGVNVLHILGGPDEFQSGALDRSSVAVEDVVVVVCDVGYGNAQDLA